MSVFINFFKCLKHKEKAVDVRLLSKPSKTGILAERKAEIPAKPGALGAAAPERRSGAYSNVREHSSTGSTHQKTDYEELRKKSIEFGKKQTSFSNKIFSVQGDCPVGALRRVPTKEGKVRLEKNQGRCIRCGMCESKKGGREETHVFDSKEKLVKKTWN
jgi:hypothetical protein